MSKIKVFHITQATVGGTLEYLKLLLQGLNGGIFENHVVCPQYGPMADELRAVGIPVHIVHMEREISLKGDAAAVMELYRLLGNEAPDIIHLHSTKAGAIGRLCGLMRICSGEKPFPCIYTPHGWSFNMNSGRLKKLLYGTVERLLSNLSHTIVAISKHEMDSAIERHIAGPDKIRLIENGIDIARYRINYMPAEVARARLGFDAATPVIGMVGRLAAQKNPLAFVRIARKIYEKGYKCRYLLVGDGELREEVRKETEKLGMREDFTITGWMADVVPYIYAMDIGVLTSRWEGFGLAAAEYMAAGKPVVASKTGGIPEIVVDGATGFLKEPEDTDGFSEGIIQLLEDKKQCELFGKNGLERVGEMFGIGRVVREHERLYEEAVKWAL